MTPEMTTSTETTKVPKRLADALARLAEAEKKLADLQADPVRAERLAALQAEYAPLEKAAAATSLALEATRRKVVEDAHINLPNGGGWHPDFIAAVEKLSGWSYEKRSELKFANAASYRDDPMSVAMSTFRQKLLEKSPEVQKAHHEQVLATGAASRAQHNLWKLTNEEEQLQRAVREAKAEVESVRIDLDVAAQRRAAKKKLDAQTRAEIQAEKEAEEKAAAARRDARAKLEALETGKVTLDALFGK